MPGVQIEGQRAYPMLLEKLVSIACVGAALLMIGPTLSADLSIPRIIQVPLAICGLPLAGFVMARILTLTIHSAATK
jgi:hypothetical protein